MAKNFYLLLIFNTQTMQFYGIWFAKCVYAAKLSMRPIEIYKK